MDAADLMIMVNAIALIAAIYQFSVQQRSTKEQFEQQRLDTKNLTVLAKKLENEVNRFSTDLSESLKRLAHAHDLMQEVHQLGFQMLIGVKPPIIISLAHELLGKMAACLVNLRAIAQIENSFDLISLVDEISNLLKEPIFLDEDRQEQLIDKMEQLEGLALKVHETIYTLEDRKLQRNHE